MRVEQREDPDEPSNPWLCWTLYNDRNNDINAQLTIHPDPDGHSNHHVPEENPVCFRVNSRRCVPNAGSAVRVACLCSPLPFLSLSDRAQAHHRVP